MNVKTIFNTLLVAGAVVLSLATPAQATLFGRNINGNAVATTAGDAVYLYDDVSDRTWLLDANYAATELSDTRRDQIINTVVSVAGHTLTADDFESSGTVYSGQMTWWGAMAWADQLIYNGIDNWELPKTFGTCSSNDCTDSEMGDIYAQLGGSLTLMDDVFHNVQYLGSSGTVAKYWSSTVYATDANVAWWFAISSNLNGQGASQKNIPEFYALAVRDGDVAVASVPEPETYTMLLAGLGLIAGISRRRKANQA